MELFEAARAEAARCGLSLERSEQGLALAGDGMVLRADFREMLPRLKPGRLPRELLVRAAKTKQASGDPPRAVDATAGLGEDALLLAAAGFRVTLFERNPVIAALLADALQRAASDPQLGGIVARMELASQDSIAALEALGAGESGDAERPSEEGNEAHGTAPDDGATCDDGAAPDAGATCDDGAARDRLAVVYLDPMFPARQKHAAVKKKFQLLHHLEDPCDDAEALLRAAFAAHPRKIVIKRPPKGPHLAGVKPSYALSGKAVRYDVIALP